MDSEKGKILLRISLSLVFLWFGFNQLFNPSDWIGFVPQLIQNIFFNVLGITAEGLVLINSFLEILLGIFLFLGLYTRFSSLILSIHLFGIALSMGLSTIAIRDYGLALATLSIFLNRVDRLCLDTRTN